MAGDQISLGTLTATDPAHVLAKAREKLGITHDPCEMLNLRWDVRLDAWMIINGRGETRGHTKLARSQIIHEAPGKTLTEKLRWVMRTHQYVPASI